MKRKKRLDEVVRRTKTIQDKAKEVAEQIRKEKEEREGEKKKPL